MQLIPLLNQDDIWELRLHVIVENWRKAQTPAFRRAFEPGQQRVLHRFYPRLYTWFYVTGAPHEIALKPHILNLLERAVAFFSHK